MLVASPLAGVWADRHGSRALSALGMVVTAAALAAMTTLGVHTAYWESTIWLFLVGLGSGMFNSPNTAAMMGTVPAHRRGIAAGARTMLQNTGAVISIAFVMAIITAAVPQDVLLHIFSGVASGLSDARLDPFIHNMHTALWVLAATSLVGAFVSLLRPRHGTVPRVRRPADRRGRAPRRHHPADDPLLRGDRAARRRRARRRGPPLLRGGRDRAAARRAAAEVAARALARGAQGAHGGRGRARRPARGVAARRPGRRAPARDPHEGLAHVDRQLALVRRRRGELDALERELQGKHGAAAGAAGASSRENVHTA